ncbi:rRNA maturation RNase YbeY [Crocosphaera sp. Alani8]|uniref:rRNA maturation RNase YbeY n=1 Tax=Crocosphaera sp. Alani8 TaxID=3038952 RepID=UPI00313D7790
MIAYQTLNAVIELNVQDVFWVRPELEATFTPVSSQTWKQWIDSWCTNLNSYLPEASSYELTLRLTGDQEIQSLNAQYRQKNQPTDVLAFATLEWDFPTIIPLEDCSEPVYLGDIVISVETAQKQAQQHTNSLKRELAWLAAHGLLHLLGWDHPDEQSLKKMLQQQETLLESVSL